MVGCQSNPDAPIARLSPTSKREYFGCATEPATSQEEELDETNHHTCHRNSFGFNSSRRAASYRRAGKLCPPEHAGSELRFHRTPLRSSENNEMRAGCACLPGNLHSPTPL